MAKKLIYLASPYSHHDFRVRRQRFLDVCTAAARIAEAGIMVYSPIAHTHPIADRSVPGIALPKSYEFWREFAERMIATCDALWVLMLDGWEESADTRAEVAFASSIGKPVAAVDPELPTLPIVPVYEDAQ